MSLDPLPVLAEVKRYQRQKILALVLNTLLSLGGLALLGLVIGPRLQHLYADYPDALRLLISAALLGVSIELLTLPIGFWSSYVLEHRYQLSTQTLRGWIWKRVK